MQLPLLRQYFGHLIHSEVSGVSVARFSEADSVIAFAGRILAHTTLRFKDHPEAVEWFGLLQDLPELVQRRSPSVRQQEVTKEKHVQEYAVGISTLYDEAEEFARSHGSDDGEGGHDHNNDAESKEHEGPRNEGGVNEMFEGAREYL